MPEVLTDKKLREMICQFELRACRKYSSNIPEYQVNRFKKEKFAAVRTAKLRLSNLKLGELTQVMRGKAKHIKH